MKTVKTVTDHEMYFLTLRRWYFYVQMVGYQEQAQDYSMEMTVFRPDEGKVNKADLVMTTVCQDLTGSTVRRCPVTCVRWK